MRPTSCIITPMFVDGRLVGYIGNTAHKPDLGGKVPGTNAGDATDLFQEGLLIPPLRILRRGQLLADIERVICANTRTPEVTWGDITAQVNTNTYGLTQVRRAVRQIRHRQSARLLADAGWIFARPSCARKSPRCPTGFTARKPITSTTTASI